MFELGNYSEIYGSSRGIEKSTVEALKKTEQFLILDHLSKAGNEGTANFANSIIKNIENNRIRPQELQNLTISATMLQEQCTSELIRAFNNNLITEQEFNSLAKACDTGIKQTKEQYSLKETTRILSSLRNRINTAKQTRLNDLMTRNRSIAESSELKARLEMEGFGRWNVEAATGHFLENPQDFYTYINDGSTRTSLDHIIKTDAKKSAQESAGVFEEAFQEEIRAKIAQERIAKEKAQKAQKYFAGISDTTTGKSAKESAKAIDQVLSIREEALAQIRQEEIAKKTAAKAQEHFTNLANSAGGKSAKESAEIIETALKQEEELLRKKVIARIEKEETAKKAAEKAQKYFAGISDATTGKSAKESAQIIEQAITHKEELLKKEVIARIEKEEAAKKATKKAQDHFTNLANSVSGKSAKESAKVFEETFKQEAKSIMSSSFEAGKTQSNEITKNTISNFKKDSANTIKDFTKEKIVPLTKTKGFKIAAASIALIGLAVGITKHAKNNSLKEENRISANA